MSGDIIKMYLYIQIAVADRPTDRQTHQPPWKDSKLSLVKGRTSMNES